MPSTPIRFPLLIALVALSGACFAATPHAQTAPSGQPGSPQAAAPAAQGSAKVCLDVATGDDLTNEFAIHLRQAITASEVMSLATSADSCKLLLHVPGNVLRFQTAGGVMVSTVVIVTSPSGHYLSTSVAACQASNLKPCAVRAVAAAKLALLVTSNDDGSD